MPVGYVAAAFGGLRVHASPEGIVATAFVRGPVRRSGDSDLLDTAIRELTEYLAGTRTTFSVPVDWSKTAGMHREVLRVLYETVPFGRTITYGELAARAGYPGQAQAVGTIMGTNPVPVIVPCHRVVAAGGLGGFGAGLETKRWLLAHEGSLTAPLPLA